MPFYSKEKYVTAYIHRRVKIKIFTWLKGDKCCEVEHHPEKHRKCVNCDKELRHEREYYFTLNNHDMNNSEVSTEPMALMKAKATVDHFLDEVDRGAEMLGVAEEDEELSEEYFADDYEDDSEPSADDDDSEEDDEQQEIPDMGILKKQMDKLGWYDRAVAVIKRSRSR